METARHFLKFQKSSLVKRSTEYLHISLPLRISLQSTLVNPCRIQRTSQPYHLLPLICDTTLGGETFNQVKMIVGSLSRPSENRDGALISSIWDEQGVPVQLGTTQEWPIREASLLPNRQRHRMFLVTVRLRTRLEKAPLGLLLILQRL